MQYKPPFILLHILVQPYLGVAYLEREEERLRYADTKDDTCTEFVLGFLLVRG